MHRPTPLPPDIEIGDVVKLLSDLDLPYKPLRKRLYTPSELLEGHEGGLDATVDAQIYRHFSTHGRFCPTLGEALAQRLHDWSIDEGLRAFIARREQSVVAIMGGHSKRRGSPEYAEIARLAYGLAKSGRLVASGGGPGIMEAANLGAYLSTAADPSVVDQALAMLAPFPDYATREYFKASREVCDRFGPGAESIAIPTWFYGHEPSNAFGSHVAKYFSNGLREDTLLAVAWGGVVFAPGKAGTWQEIFMDLSQNYYATYPFLSPMIFLGQAYYETETGIAPLVQRLASQSPHAPKLATLIKVADSAAEALAILEAMRPQRSDGVL